MIKSSILSFDQERLWRRHQENPDAPTYNVYSSTRLSGPLDVQAFEDAWNAIARRHEIWRTTYRQSAGAPKGVVSPYLTIRVPVIGLEHLPPEQREEEAMCRVVEEARRPFDLERGPVVRVSLLRLNEREHIMTFAIHHLAHDRVSYTILHEELAEYYRAYCTGESARLPMPEAQFSEYAAWQRDWYMGSEPERKLRYWRRKLSGASQRLELRTDRPRPPKQTHEGARVIFEIPADLSRAYKNLARQEGVSHFMFLLAIYYLLLHQEAGGQQDLLVGTPFANRLRPEFERTLGYFLTSTILRTHVSGEMSFRELLRAVRTCAVEAFDHQGIPYSKLIEELQPHPDPSRNPIFQAMFVYLNHPEELQITLHGGLVMEGFLYDAQTSRYDLTICFEERPNNSTLGFLEYNIDLHDRSTAQRMVEDVMEMMARLTADPDCRVNECLRLSGAVSAGEVRVQRTGPQPVFLFPGLGSHYLNMGAELYREEPVIRRVVDECAEMLRPELGVDLRDVMFTGDAPASEGVDLRKLLRRDRSDQPPLSTPVAHTSLFVIEYALSRLLMERGVFPAAMLGHSVGEYVAACLAGVFSLDNALMLVARRAKMTESLPKGAMLAVNLPEEAVRPVLNARLHLAAVNGTEHCLLSGTEAAIVLVQEQWNEQGIVCYRLETSTAFHSPMLLGMADEFETLVRSCAPQAPQIPYISNVTGTWITARQAADPAYWVDHLCSVVRFAQGVATLAERPETVFVEVGPGHTLGTFVRQSTFEHDVLATMRHAFDPRPDREFVAAVLDTFAGEGIR